MGNINNFGRKDWSCASVTRESCSTVTPTLTAGTEIIFTEITAPRFLTANTDGFIDMEDWAKDVNGASAPNSVHRNVIAGQTIYTIPSKILDTTTADIILEY